MNPFGDYLLELRVQRRLAERTLILYADALARLQAGCEQLGVPLDQLRPSGSRELLAELQKRGYSLERIDTSTHYERVAARAAPTTANS